MEIRTQLLEEFVRETISDLGYDSRNPDIAEAFDTFVHFGETSSRRDLVLFIEGHLDTIFKLSNVNGGLII